MKNKTMWLSVGLIAVVVVGAAVYFGNTQTQKGSFNIVRPPAEGQPSSVVTYCGTSWAQAFAGTFSTSSTSRSVPPANLTVREGDIGTLEKAMIDGCEVKLVVKSTRGTVDSYTCARSSYDTTYSGDQVFSCVTPLLSNNEFEAANKNSSSHGYIEETAVYLYKNRPDLIPTMGANSITISNWPIVPENILFPAANMDIGTYIYMVKAYVKK